MPETFLLLTHLPVCSTLFMGWNLSPIKSCHPECIWQWLPNLLGRLWVQAAAKAAQVGLRGNPHSDLPTDNTSPFPPHKRCPFVGLAEATPVPSLAELRVQGGKCRAAFLLVTALSTSCFPIGSSRQEARVEALCCVVLRCCIIPIRLRCQQVTRDWHFSYWFFPVAHSALSMEITASALCQVLIPPKSVTELQLTPVGLGFK